MSSIQKALKARGVASSPPLTATPVAVFAPRIPCKLPDEILPELPA